MQPGETGWVFPAEDPGALAGIFADHAIRLIGNGTTGANKDGFHLRNVNVGRDLAVTKFGDFRRVRAGEPDELVRTLLSRLPGDQSVATACGVTYDDLHASPEYRAHLITVMAKRAVEAALR